MSLYFDIDNNDDEDDDYYYFKLLQEKYLLFIIILQFVYMYQKNISSLYRAYLYIATHTKNMIIVTVSYYAG